MRISAILIALTLVFTPVAASSQGAELVWHPYVLVMDQEEKTTSMFVDDKAEGYPTQEACTERKQEMVQGHTVRLLSEQKDPANSILSRCSTNNEAEETAYIAQILGLEMKPPGQDI